MMGEIEYKDNEKVLYKTRVKLSLPGKEPEKVGCVVTEGHIIVDAQKRIKIPVSRILVCDAYASPYSAFSHIERGFSQTATLTFLDDLNEKKKLSLEMVAGDVGYFKYEIEKLIAKQPKSHKPRRS